MCGRWQTGGGDSNRVRSMQCDNDGAGEKPGRAEFHQLHEMQAEAEARRLLAERERLQGRWLDWVAGELYALTPPEYASMVRRALSRLG